MEFDPYEQFREDPGEMELSPEFQAQLELQRQAEEIASEEPLTSTEEQPEPAPQPEASTELQENELQPVETSPFKNPDGSLDLEKMRQYGAERDMDVVQGIADFGVDVLNIIPGVNIPKANDFENEVAQSVREISSVVVPTMVFGGAMQAAGVAANSRVGWSLGQNKFVQWIGSRGVEALAGLGVGAVSSEYTEDNLAGTLKKRFPKTYDFIQTVRT